jgi:hypothetical protein
MRVSFPNNSVFTGHKTQEKAAAQTQLSADPVEEWLLKRDFRVERHFSFRRIRKVLEYATEGFPSQAK